MHRNSEPVISKAPSISPIERYATALISQVFPKVDEFVRYLQNLKLEGPKIVPRPPSQWVSFSPLCATLMCHGQSPSAHSLPAPRSWTTVRVRAYWGVDQELSGFHWMEVVPLLRR